jgi:pyrophosphatase PpaX
MPPCAVLFDLDGTLIDSVPLIVESMQHAFEGRRRAPTVEEWVARIGTPLEGMIREWAEDEADLAQLKERYKAHQWAHHDARVTAFPGVPELLDRLSAAGTAMAVVTSKLEASASRSLVHVGIARHFRAVVGLESTARHKPDPEPVLHALALLGAEAAAAAFVGDSPHDVRAGNGAGVPTVAALWGPFSRAALAEAGPTSFAEAVSDVLDVLDRLGRSGSEAVR